MLLRARYLSSLGTNRASFLNGYVSGIPDPMPYANLPDLFTNTLGSISRLFVTSPIQVFGEKSPLHTPYADWIRNLYPNAKTILVVRRPVANVASIYRRYGDFKRVCRAYDMYAAKLMEMSQEPNVLVVRHEDVTQATSSTLRRVLGFLDASLRLDESCPINAYTKTAYTGKEIDQNRDGTTASTLKEHQVELVKGRFHRVTERFYGD